MSNKRFSEKEKIMKILENVPSISRKELSRESGIPLDLITKLLYTLSAEWKIDFEFNDDGDWIIKKHKI